MQPKSVDEHVQEALSESRRGNWTEAEAHARDAVTLGGDAHAALLGEILFHQGKDESEAWLRRAVVHDSRDAGAYCFLGRVHAGRHEWDAAVACFDDALSGTPGFADAVQGRDLTNFLRTVHATYRQFAGRTGLDPDIAGDDDVEFPAASRDGPGPARFRMSLPLSVILSDVGAAYLFQYEVARGGWESVLRRFIDAHLASDDVFVDAGAHWGVHSLTAATRWRSEVSVLGIEAHPLNAKRLQDWVRGNGLDPDIEVVEGAVADREGVARMRVDRSSMGYSLSSGESGEPTIEVRVTTIDKLMAERPRLHWRRIVMKIDVEGFELEVLEGARRTFESGLVAAVIWEKARFHEPAVQRDRDRRIFDFLSQYGFRHFHFEHEEVGGPLKPLVDVDNIFGNVYSIAPSLQLQPSY